MKRTIAVTFAVVGLLVACSASGTKDSFSTTPLQCSVGQTRDCVCSDGRPSFEVCQEEPNVGNQFGICACGTLPATASVLPSRDSGAPSDAASVCGDGVCGAGETCRTCARDCGECPQCLSAPSCSDAVGIPVRPTLRDDLSQTSGDLPREDAGAGPPPPAKECKDPELRLRIERITSRKGGGQLYCVVSATDGASSEVAITAKTKNLGDNESHFFDPGSAMFWGQKTLHPTTNNLTITYNCFRVKGDSWAKVLGAMGDSAAKVGGVAGPYGWVFGAGAVAADAAAAAVQAGAGDELMFNAQQVLDKNGLTDLTNGRYWVVRKGTKGGFFGGGWEWELYVQSWGCADANIDPR